MIYINYICIIINNKTDIKMTTKEIYNLANEMTEQEVFNVIGGWENEGATEDINTYNTLVSLGDSKQLACASVIAERYTRSQRTENHNEMYEIAYYS